MRPGGLKCEYAVNPLGIDAAQPRFSWLLESDRRGQVQTAYRVLVASTEQVLADGVGDKWESGKVESDRSVNVPYEGGALASGEKCYWQVRCWDRDGEAGPSSVPATFEMGLLDAGDWQGKWIGTRQKVSSPLLRKTFTCSKPVRRARVYVCGLGYYELHVNGRRVGDHVLDPATTYYRNIRPFELQARALYVTYDVTEMLRQGANVMAVMLGHGWYSADGDPPGRTPYADRPTLLLQMNVEFEDGETMAIATDESWKSASGPITANDFAGGEHYDARLEIAGWDAPESDDSEWDTAVLATAPGGVLTAQSLPPIRVMQTLRPTRILESATGSHIFDMGQHFSGWARLRVKGPRGARVTLRYAGRVNYDVPALDRRNNLWFTDAEQTDSYVLKGGGVEVWEPRFTLHGFRYVEVIGYPGTPTLDDLEGRVVYTAVETVGDFECSNDLINSIHHNACWTFMASMQGIPQDAAERAERVGWLGDTGFVIEDYLYNFDTASFWAKWVLDIRDAQKADGAVPHVSPVHWSGGYSYWPTWQSTYPVIVWRLFQYYGDARVLAEHYDGVKKLVDYFGTQTEGLIVPEDEWGKMPLGDHMEPQPDRTSSHFPNRTSPSLCSTAYYYFSAVILARMAAELGRDADADTYSELARKIKDAYNRKFLDEATNQYSTGSQTSNALSLYLGLVPAEREQAVLANLVDDIMNEHGGHLSTGIIGTDALEQALPEFGRADVMYTIAAQTTFPSWGYMVVNGATSIWEDWEGSDRRSVSMKMLASCEKFFYKDLAGISPAAPGFGRIIVRPQPVGDLTWAKASYMSVHGPIESGWRLENGRFHLSVTIPANTSATVVIPTSDPNSATEGNLPVERTEGVRVLERSRDEVILGVGSGTYQFSAARPGRPI